MYNNTSSTLTFFADNQADTALAAIQINPVTQAIQHVSDTLDSHYIPPLLQHTLENAPHTLFDMAYAYGMSLSQNPDYRETIKGQEEGQILHSTLEQAHVAASAAYNMMQNDKHVTQIYAEQTCQMLTQITHYAIAQATAQSQAFTL